MKHNLLFILLLGSCQIHTERPINLHVKSQKIGDKKINVLDSELRPKIWELNIK